MRTSGDAPATTFLRHQLGAIAATAVDFGTMILLVRFAGVDPVPATGVGALVGALTNFTLARRWIFAATNGAALGQALRYALVAVASLALNVAGEALVFRGLHVPYVLARVIVAVSVSVFWNFPMHRHFAFGASS